MKEQILVLEDKRFKQLLEMFDNHGIEYDKNAFCCILEDESFILLREDFVNSLTVDEVNVVISHEMAHLTGIIDEEEADRWALNELNERAQTILKDMWEHRHGHEYESNL